MVTPWVSIEVVGPAVSQWARHGGFGSRETVSGAAEDIVVVWLCRVRDEGLPF